MSTNTKFWRRQGGEGTSEKEIVAEVAEANQSIVIALVLTITNTLAFSRCDKFSQASGLVERGLYSGSLARNVGGALVSRMFGR